MKKSQPKYSRLWRPLIRTSAIGLSVALFCAGRTFAQAGGGSPWENAVNVLQTAFTGPIAKGLALVAIVVGGLTFAFGEGGGKKTFAGIVFGLGMAVLAVNFLSLSDEFSAKIASELCGQEEKWRVNYNISESGHDSRVSYLTGKPLADKAHISTSKTYSQQRDYRFDTKTFTELKNAQSITLAYDGRDPLPPTFCYLKPYFNDVNKSYFQQLADGQL